MITYVFFGQKRVNVSEHTVKTEPHELWISDTRIGVRQEEGMERKLNGNYLRSLMFVNTHLLTSDRERYL